MPMVANYDRAQTAYNLLKIKVLFQGFGQDQKYELSYKNMNWKTSIGQE